MTIIIGKCDSCDKKRKLESFSNGTSVYYKCDECIQQQYGKLCLDVKKAEQAMDSFLLHNKYNKEKINGIQRRFKD